MNYDDVAQKIADGISDAEMLPTLHANSVREIAAALRRAANEAAWRGHDIASQYGIMSNRPASEIVASEYGPRPEGGTR